MKIIDLNGQVFGRWTVIERGLNKGRHVRWICRCECGNTGLVTSSNLVQGISRSCGCFHIDKITTHGEYRSPEYRAWVSMKSRCYTKSNIGYPYYGGRGIIVCDRWLNNFENFLTDMGYKPSAGYSLDRIDPNGNYCPENCRWSVREVQDNNRRDSVIITFDGKTQTVAQWAREKGIHKTTLRGRLEWGWPIEDALTWKPVKGRVNQRHVKPV